MKESKKIKLTHGKYALVDYEDFEYLNQWKWHLNDSGYAVRSEYMRLGLNKYTSKNIRMHRLINNTPDGLSTDHINQNKLDNRKKNLRSVNKSVNAINSKIKNTNKSWVTGVYWDKFTKKWRAEIKLNYKKITLGRFADIKDAIIARRKGELKYHAI